MAIKRTETVPGGLAETTFIIQREKWEKCKFQLLVLHFSPLTTQFNVMATRYEIKHKKLVKKRRKDL